MVTSGMSESSSLDRYSTLVSICRVSNRGCKRQAYTLRDYIGRGNAGFEVQLALSWHLDEALGARSVTIDGSPIPECEVSVPYEELNDSNMGIAQTSAEIGGRLIRRIGEISATPFRDDP